MPSTWQFLFFKPKGPIVLIGKVAYWEQECSYRNISQTLSQCDMNPGETRESRKLARHLIETLEARKVRLSKNTIFIDFNEITQAQAEGISGKIKSILAEHQF